MRDFAILLGFDALGTVIQRMGVPLPGNVIGMVLLAVALMAGWVQLKWVEQGANFLLRYLVLWFVPVILSAYFALGGIAGQWLPIVAAIGAGTVATLIVTGKWVQAGEVGQGDVE